MDCFSEQKVRSMLEVFNQIPECIFWKDENLEYQLMNTQAASFCGFKSSEVSFEKITDFDLNCAAVELAENFQSADKKVLSSKKTTTYMDLCNYNDNGWTLLFCRRSPIFDDCGKVIGVYGRGVDVTDCAIMRSAFLLLNSESKVIGANQNKRCQYTYSLMDNYEDYNFSIRESEVLFYILRGKTAKQIGQIIGLSYRTVEKHIEHIRYRLDCNTRSEVVEKALYLGLGTIVPKSVFSSLDSL